MNALSDAFERIFYTHGLSFNIIARHKVLVKESLDSIIFDIDISNIATSTMVSIDEPTTPTLTLRR
jgi:hypothetical protein